MKNVFAFISLSMLALVAFPACVGAPEDLDATNASVAEDEAAQDTVAENSAGDLADAIVEEDLAADSSEYALTCTSYWNEVNPQCLGRCQAYPTKLRLVGSWKSVPHGGCQKAVNEWCLARNYGFATFACWGHL